MDVDFWTRSARIQSQVDVGAGQGLPECLGSVHGYTFNKKVRGLVPVGLLTDSERVLGDARRLGGLFWDPAALFHGRGGSW